MTKETLIRPDSGGETPPGDAPSIDRISRLPEDLIRDSRRRLRILAYLYAFVFFMAGVLPALISGPVERARFFADFVTWGPAAISIAIALGVASLTSSSGVGTATIVHIGLVFEVVASFGIASAEYGELYAPAMSAPGEYRGLGIGWVAVWMLLYTVVVPTPPRKALAAAIVSASSVPIVVGFHVFGGQFALAVTAPQFAVGVAMPYALVVLMAYVGARLVFKLGTDVTRARELGSYRLTELVGRGGMGEVWKARHRLLARPAAIKLLNAGVIGEPGSSLAQTALARFEREAQATASMRSPHTISVYDFGLTADGMFYYVMELLDGYNLDTLVTRFGPVPPERVVHILRQICHSLAEAHAAGLIHRDVKPANVFVCRYGREVDFVKVLDFGLVKLGSTPEHAGTDITREFAGGTPAYMAPEQIQGDKAIDGRADIYATGCLAYWLLTGHYVFEGNAMKVMADHMHTPPVPPSRRIGHPIPEALETIVLKCLAKAPADRYQHVDELVSALDACPADDPWSPTRSREWWSEHAGSRSEDLDVTPART